MVQSMQEVLSGFCYAPGLTIMVSPGYSPEAQWSPFYWPRSPDAVMQPKMVTRNNQIWPKDTTNQTRGVVLDISLQYLPKYLVFAHHCIS